MTAEARGPAALNRNAGRLRSRMGGVVPGRIALFRGKNLHIDLQDIDWFDLYVFGITGRRLTPEQLRVLNAVWTYTSYPDARLWNNRVAALAGSVRSSGNLGVSAALAVSEAAIYGRGIDIRAIDFLIRAKKYKASGTAIEPFVRQELAIRRSIAGFGRPLTSADERIGPMLALAKKMGLTDGEHLAIAREVEGVLLKGRWRLRLNYAGVAAALAADSGLSPREYYLFTFPAFLAGMLPCFIEAADNPEGTLFPLSCGDIQYVGVSRRSWPCRGTSGEASDTALIGRRA